MKSTPTGNNDDRRKRKATMLKVAGSAVLLFSFLTQNFLYDAWDARATLLEKGMVERGLIDKSVLLNEVLYFTAQPSSGTSVDDLKRFYIHEAARKLAYSSNFPVASDELLTTREKVDLSNALLSQANGVDDFPSFLALVRTANESYGKYAEEFNLEYNQANSETYKSAVHLSRAVHSRDFVASCRRPQRIAPTR
jgi:hypothetical protein